VEVVFSYDEGTDVFAEQKRKIPAGIMNQASGAAVEGRP